jgi:hypothetical protein
MYLSILIKTIIIIIIIINDENRLGREELARRDVENKAVLKKLEEKIDSVTSSSENGSPPARKRVRRRRT